MQVRTGIATLAVALLTVLLAPVWAQAAPTLVHVRIEGKSETLFEGPILTEGHDVEAASDSEARPCDGINPLDPQNKTPGPTPTAASVDATSLIGETFDGQWYPGYHDYFITRWGPDREEEGMSWGVLVNNVFTNVGGCQYELGTGDEVLWAYNAFGHRPFLALFPAGDTSGTRSLTATAELNKPFEVEVLDYSDDAEDVPPAHPERTGSAPFEGADVSPVATSAKGFERVETEGPTTVTTDAQGKASITFTEPGWHRIKATAVNGKGEEDVIRSNRLDVCVPNVGETGCGEPPAEDALRIPLRYAEEAKAEHHEETKEMGAGNGSPNNGSPSGGGPSGGQPGTDSNSDGGSSQGALTAATTTTSTGKAANGPPPRLVVESVSPARLLLKLTAAGAVTVRIALQPGKGHNRRWRNVKTIALKTSKPGLVKVELPRLAAGRYRVSIALAASESVVRTLTVPGR
jgi:hypothetical protein